MSIWGKIAGAVAGAVAGPVGAVAGAVAGHLLVDKELERDVAFTIALIALSAKMAKSDGIVSRLRSTPLSDLPCRIANRKCGTRLKLAQEDVAGLGLPDRLNPFSGTIPASVRMYSTDCSISLFRRRPASG